MQRFGLRIDIDLKLSMLPEPSGTNELEENESVNLTNPRMLCQDLPRLSFAITAGGGEEALLERSSLLRP